VAWYYDEIIWYILECLSCEGVILLRECKKDRARDVECKIDILYPSSENKLIGSNIPDNIKEKYERALKVQRIEPNAFAVAVGRTLEAICIHEHANGKTLADKLHSLAKGGRIPEMLAEMAGQLRLLRNMAAHIDADEVLEEDVPIIREYLDAILEYLYVAPAKIARLQARLDREKNINGF